MAGKSVQLDIVKNKIITPDAKWCQVLKNMISVHMIYETAFHPGQVWGDKLDHLYSVLVSVISIGGLLRA